MHPFSFHSTTPYVTHLLNDIQNNNVNYRVRSSCFFVPNKLELFQILKSLQALQHRSVVVVVYNANLLLSKQSFQLHSFRTYQNKMNLDTCSQGNISVLQFEFFLFKKNVFYYSRISYDRLAFTIFVCRLLSHLLNYI